MDLTPDPRLERLVETLYERYAPIFTEWRATQADAALPQTAKECLYRDLLLLGRALSGLDAQGERQEMKLLAEILALVKKNGDSLPYGYLVETVDKEIGSAKAATSDFSPSAATVLPDLLIACVVNEWSAGNPARKAAAKAVSDALLDLVNGFVLHDGNISGKEIGVFAVLEKKFAL